MKIRLLHAGLSGLAGALTLTLLHQLLKKSTDKAPRMDAIGMNAIAAALEKSNFAKPNKEVLYWVTMAGDIVSNTLYYATTVVPKNNSALAALGSGLTAGIGAVVLPGPMHLGAQHSGRTTSTRLLTVGIYVSGAMATYYTYQAIQNYN